MAELIATSFYFSFCFFGVLDSGVAFFSEMIAFTF